MFRRSTSWICWRGERQRTHGDLCNLSRASRRRRRPGRCARRPPVRWSRRARLHGRARASPSCGGHRRALRPHPTAWPVTADDVVVTTGSSGGFLLAFLAAFDAGDRVAIARPGYPGYRNMLAALGCEVVELPCGPETRFQPTVAMLEALDEPVRRADRGQPGQPDRDDADARRAGRAGDLVRARTGSGWSATRSTTASPTPGAPAHGLRLGRPRARRSSSTRSRSTSR